MKQKKDKKVVPAILAVPIAPAIPAPTGFLSKLFPGQKDSKSVLYVSLIFLAYIIIAFMGIARHEMWRDELEPWLIGSGSSTLSEFFHNMKMGSNPYVWYLILHFISKISMSPVIAQIAHVLFAIGAVYLFLRFSSFTILQKLLFCLGYYIIFEYSIISRGYALTIFFLFLFCALYKTYWNKVAILGVVIFFLANATGGFGAILSVSLLLFLGSNFVFNEMSGYKNVQRVTQMGWGVLIILFGIWVAFKSITPPADSVYSTKWFVEWDGGRISSILSRVWTGFVPIPLLSPVQFWNTNILATGKISDGLGTMLTIISLLFLIYCILLFARKISVLLFYLSGSMGVLFFSYMNSSIFIINGARYNGFLFIIFIISLWLLQYFPGKKGVAIPVLTSLSEKLNVAKFKNGFLMFLLSANVLAGAVAYSKDFAYQFSSVEKAGKYITENKLEKYVTAGFIDYAVSPITAFTRQPVYYPDRDTTSTFPIWRQTKYTTDMNVIADRLVKFVSAKKDAVLVILNFDLNTTMIGDVHFSRLASFKGAIVADENFSIYMADKLETAKGNNQRAKTILFADIAKGDEADKGYFQLGMLYYNEQQNDSAIYCWEQAVALNPAFVDAYNNLAVTYMNYRQDLNKAQECWSKAVEINPDYMQGYFNLMTVCQAKNDEVGLAKYIRIALSKGVPINDIKSRGIVISDALMKKITS